MYYICMIRIAYHVHNLFTISLLHDGHTLDIMSIVQETLLKGGRAMATWYVTGQDEWTMKPKTIVVKAPTKQEAIEIGLNKLDTKRLYDCRLKQA